MHDMTVIQSELENELNQNKGCIIFDFGCYFPYSNVQDLIFDFHLGLESFSDKKMNHRYPNKSYQTISRKYGRKVSKLGYPYFFDIHNSNLPIFFEC